MFIGALNRLGAITRAVRAAIASIYAVKGLEPETVLDFENEYYKAGDFDTAITHARNSNATMVDSDGLLKWAPHNLFTYSEQFDNAVWLKTNATITANSATAPNGTTTADSIDEGSTTNSHFIRTLTSVTQDGTKYTLSTFAKYTDCQYFRISASSAGSYWASTVFDIQNGLVADSGTGAALFTIYNTSITPVGDGWYKCSMTFSTTYGLSVYAYFALSNSSTAIYPSHSNGIDSYTGTNRTMYIWGAHAYRSDLGGMVDNPDRGDSYVPTTTSARYLPRRGHHVYNGSAWVNEGLLVESEQRINLLPQSNDFSASWVLGNATQTAAQGTGPDGLTSLTKLAANATSSRFVDIADTTPAYNTLNQVWTFSAFMKADEVGFGMLIVSPSTDNWVNATYNLSTGAVTQTSGGATSGTVQSAGAVDYGAGLWRCWMTFSLNTTDATCPHYIAASDTGTPSLDNRGRLAYSAVVDEGILIGSVQLEVGSTPSSYIPNAGTSGGVTRAAETLTVPAAQLPWPEPNVIGSELVTNGNGSSTTGWSVLNVSISTDGSKFTQTATTATSGGSYQTISTQAGKLYKLQAAMDQGTSTSIRCRVDDGASVGTGSIFEQIGTGSIDTLFVAQSSQTTIYFRQGTTAIGNQSTFENISVKEIDPLSVSIQMDGRMTYADENTSGNALFAYWFISSSDNIQLILDTETSKVGQVRFQQRSSGSLNTVTSSGDAYSPGILVPYNIASRHGSTFINGAVDGTASTANTTPTALPDLSTTDLSLAYDYMGTVKLFRVWANDLGDDGIATASTPDIPANAITQRDGSYILDRSGSYIETRA